MAAKTKPVNRVRRLGMHTILGIFAKGDAVIVKDTNWARHNKMVGFKGIVEQEITDRWWLQIRFATSSQKINIAHLEKVE